MEARTEIELFKAYLESRKAPGWHVVSYEIENSSSNQLCLIVEPYGTQVIVPLGRKCVIVAEEPEGHAMSITFSDHYVQVWADGLIEVFEDGARYGITSTCEREQ